MTFQKTQYQNKLSRFPSVIALVTKGRDNKSRKRCFKKATLVETGHDYTIKLDDQHRTEVPEPKRRTNLHKHPSISQRLFALFIPFHAVTCKCTNSKNTSVSAASVFIKSSKTSFFSVYSSPNCVFAFDAVYTIKSNYRLFAAYSSFDLVRTHQCGILRFRGEVEISPSQSRETIPNFRN